MDIGGTTLEARVTIGPMNHCISMMSPDDNDIIRAEVQARDLSIKRKYRKAAALLTTALEKHPDNPRLLKERAIVYAELGWNRKAVIDVDRMIEIIPNDTRKYPDIRDAHTTKGIVLRELGKYEAALESIEQALEYDFVASDGVRVSQPEAVMNKSELLIKLDRPKEAIDFLTRFIDTDPTKYFTDTHEKYHLWLYEFRADAYNAAGKRKKAVEDLTYMIEENPIDEILTRLLRKRAHIYNELGWRNKALADIDRMIEIKPTIHAYVFKVGVLENAGRHKEALIETKNAVKVLGTRFTDILKKIYQEKNLT